MELFSVVTVRNSNQIGVVVAGPIKIPYYDDCVASQAAFAEWDIQDPKNWEKSFDGYVVWIFQTSDYSIHTKENLFKLEENLNEGYIPFDHGTALLKNALGLIAFANKFYGKHAVEYEIQKLVK